MLPAGHLTMTPPPNKKSDRDTWFIAFGTYGAVGFQLVGSMLAGVFVGQWLDKHWQTDPWLMMLGLFLGAGSGFYNLYRILKWKNSQDE